MTHSHVSPLNKMPQGLRPTWILRPKVGKVVAVFQPASSKALPRLWPRSFISRFRDKSWSCNKLERPVAKVLVPASPRRRSFWWEEARLQALVRQTAMFCGSMVFLRETGPSPQA